jgi:hypothetical protein
MNDLAVLPGAKFLVPDSGDKVDSGIGLSSRPAIAKLCTITLYIGWQAMLESTTYIPPFKDYEFGFWCRNVFIEWRNFKSRGRKTNREVVIKRKT